MYQSGYLGLPYCINGPRHSLLTKMQSAQNPILLRSLTAGRSMLAIPARIKWQLLKHCRVIKENKEITIIGLEKNDGDYCKKSHYTPAPSAVEVNKCQLFHLVYSAAQAPFACLQGSTTILEQLQNNLCTGPSILYAVSSDRLSP